MPGGSKKGGGLKTKQTYKKGYKNKVMVTNGPAKKNSKPVSVAPKRKKVRSVGLR